MKSVDQRSRENGQYPRSRLSFHDAKNTQSDRLTRKRLATGTTHIACMRGPIIESVAFIFGLKIEKSCTTVS
jgi:hypothetical protein